MAHRRMLAGRGIMVEITIRQPQLRPELIDSIVDELALAAPHPSNASLIVVIRKLAVHKAFHAWLFPILSFAVRVVEIGLMLWVKPRWTVHTRIPQPANNRIGAHHEQVCIDTGIQLGPRRFPLEGWRCQTGSRAEFAGRVPG